MNTHTMKTEPKIEQWMRDAATEHYKPAYLMPWDSWHNEMGKLAAIIARHAPTNQQTQQTSIWRPVSVKPTLEDGDSLGDVAWALEGVLVLDKWHIKASKPTHWTRTADLLALAPLPVEKTQEERDAEFIRTSEIPNGTWSECITKAIAYGRATKNQTT